MGRKCFRKPGIESELVTQRVGRIDLGSFVVWIQIRGRGAIKISLFW
jgi:hypothetical protein